MTTAAVTAAAGRIRLPKRRRGVPVAFVDVILVLLMVYMTQTEFIKTTTDSSESASSEMTLPPVDLSAIKESNDVALDGSRSNLVVVSLTTGGNGIQWAYGEEQIDANQMKARLTSEMPSEVCLRIDEDVTHGETMQVVDLCREAGVNNVSFAFRQKGGGK